MAKTKGQVEKQKRAAEKRKKIEKAVLKMAAEMPDDDLRTEAAKVIPTTTATKGKT